ncbi:MerR family transcriptional regulator [Paenibacillus nanensis]|uniref:MerR family transcriptional regulator n=1 Tax=Paenibacillus nanensis TaxID=393251 RepID=A0A3A1V1H1_9BACL|nr:TioE family transcriptional regulator [Paenibacillus nanensis]RIX51430.1 MerR family transcriptional regulator [Paenibacillus nanensis]
MEYYKPVEIARELHISTSAMRHYEAWGIVPPPERGANGYRLYTRTHRAYFRCLRAMFAGFGTAVTSEALRYIQAGDMDAAFWLVNREQAALYQEKEAADKTLSLLQSPDPPIPPGRKPKSRMTIGEAAELAGVRASAIRHWEKEGLIIPERDPDNGYRLYTPTHLRQILLIRTLRGTVYFLEHMKELVQAVEHQSFEKAKRVAVKALRRIHERGQRQFYAVHQLVELCKEVGLMPAEGLGNPYTAQDLQMDTEG